MATFKGDDGKTYELRLGPIWFWNNNEFELKENIAAEIKGEVEKKDNVIYFYPYTIKQSGETIRLTAKDGAPLWAGHGKGYGRGMGRGNGCCGHGTRRGNGNCWN